ncbi:hypothetical protein CIY_06210 [Butyrivibrio fibrisolvens 16/4]|nr:hypothetical protein CIY_06210 [Butyrivibrio fibrisolvens 16/4]
MLKFWIGKNGLSNGILILGESHYNDEGDVGKEVPDCYTCGVMDRYFNQVDEYPFFDKIAASFGYSIREEVLDFYNNLCFGNYITRFCEKRHGAAANELIAKEKVMYNNRLFEFVNTNNIKMLFCFSKRVYWNLPGANARDIDYGAERINGWQGRRIRTINKYKYSKQVLHANCFVELENDLTVYGIAHPTGSYGYRPEEMYRFLEKEEGIRRYLTL